MSEIPIIIEGDFFQDHRGRIDFINDFKLDNAKRMYLIRNSESNKFRGWQGHKVEKRWFLCVKGVFEVSVVKIDNWDNPNNKLVPLKYTLTEENPQVLYVPNGYANGLRALEKDSKLIAISDYELGVHKDEYRFTNNLWQ